MPKKLLEKLGLRRRPPQAAPAPAPNQAAAAVAAQPAPPQQAPPPQPVQPAPAPQAPAPQAPGQQAPPPQQAPAPGWVAADKTGRRAQPGPLNKPAQQQQADFEKKVAAALPEIRRAKQLALTVDGKRIEAAKADAKSKFAAAMTGLAGKLTPQIKVLDRHSSVVRQKAEAFDFAGAEQELAKALGAAHDMLELEADFQRACLESGTAPPKELAGQQTRSAEQRAYEEEYEDSRTAFQSALAVVSDNAAVKREQQELRRMLDEARSAANQDDFAGATKLLRSIVDNCQVIGGLARADEQYQDGRRSLAPQIAVVQSIDPRSDAGADRQAALDLLAQADAAAAKGKFDVASGLSRQFEQAAEKLVPHDDLDARIFPEAVASIRPLVQQALALDSPCRAMIDRKKALGTMLPGSEDAAAQRDFRTAYELIDGAKVLASDMLRLDRQWAAYAAAEDAAHPLLNAVGKLKPTKKDQLAALKKIHAERERASKDAIEGRISAAQSLLASVVEEAQQLLSAVQSPAALDFYREWGEIRAAVEAAETIKSPVPAVQDAQKELLEARRAMDQSAAAGDIDGAQFMLGVVETRRHAVERMAALADDYSRAEKALAKQFAVAQAADPKLPGVAALQQKLGPEQAAARQQLAADPAAAKKLLLAAAGTANRIAALAEQAARQTERAGAMQPVLGSVKRSYLPAGGADNLQTLSDGAEFDAVLAAMRTAEQTRSDGDLDQLAAAARAWLALLPKMPPDQAADSETVKRRQVCETALKQAKHLRLANQFDALGPPPWPQDKEDRAADIHVTMMLESGDLPLDSAAGGVTGAKWIKEMDWEEGKGKRQFIFKRTDVPPPEIPGFPVNGEAPREVLGNEVGKQLKAMTGIDFNAPETRIVSIDGGKLPGGTPGTPVAGSAQAAAPAIGNVADVYLKNPEVFKQVPARELQKMAMFDMISMNMDRHQDNFLITPPGEGQPPQLVPIDNGLAFPNREGFNARRGKYAGGKALEWFPQGYEPFDDDSLAAIDAIDADEIVAGLKARLDTLEQEHPDLAPKSKVDPESFDMIKNSVEFMKAAAKELSPVFLMDALMIDGDKLLFGTPQERADKTKEVVEKGKRNQAAYTRLVGMNFDQKKVFYKALYELGWLFEAGDPSFNFTRLVEWDAWGRQNAEKAIAIHDRQTPCPAVVRENNALLAEIKRFDPATTIEAKIRGASVRKSNADLHDAAKQARDKARYAVVVAEINARFNDNLQLAGMKDGQLFKLAKKYDEFVRWGGEKMTEIHGHPFKQNSFDAVYSTLAQQIGPTSDHNRLIKLVALPEYAEMNKLVVKYAGEPIDPQDVGPEELAQRIDRFREFERLGGMEALYSAGFDLEKFDSSFKALVGALQSPQQLDEVAVG